MDPNFLHKDSQNKSQSTASMETNQEAVQEKG